MITHLEPDILECKVKRALRSITTDKASGGDSIPVELFQILKDDAAKVLHSICQQVWKTQQWPQDWKRSDLFQSQRKAMPKNVPTTVQLCSFHTKILQVSLQQYMNWEIPDIQAGFRKGRGTRIQTANICWITEKAREFQKSMFLLQ